MALPRTVLPMTMLPKPFTPISRFATVILVLVAMRPLFAATSLTEANADLQAGKADQAAELLNAALKADSNNAEANNLLCRVQYSVEQYNEAVDSCQKAVSASPNAAAYHHWLGRALGQKASKSSFLSAFALAKKTREEFEISVKLDPKNADALADLGEFYEEAPGQVGGGIDKAQQIATRLDAIDSARAHNLRGEIAVKQKDLITAENEFKAAINAPHPAVAWMELASFYRRQERWDDMAAAINSGAAAAAKDPKSAIALSNGAGVLIHAKREPQLAVKLLTSYLASPNKTEDAPAFVDLVRRARLLEKSGDSAGAARDQAAAAALARDYKPPQEKR